MSRESVSRSVGEAVKTGEGETANFLPFLIPGKFGNLRFGKFDLMSHGRDDRRSPCPHTFSE